MLYRQTPQGLEMWRGERIDGILYQINIEDLWAEADLNAIGLYLFDDPGIPEGFYSESSIVELRGNRAVRVHSLKEIQPIKLDMPYVTTPDAAIEMALDMAEVGPGDTFVDLGCGDGRVLIAAASRGAKVIGVDIDPGRIFEAASNLAAVGVQADLRQEDYRTTDLSSATVVYGFFTENHAMIAAKELNFPAGCKLVSYAFVIPWLAPEKINEIGDRVMALYRF